MPTFYKLDKIVSADSTFRAEADKFYIIKAAGTDAGSLQFQIAGKRTAKISSTVAPLHKTASNFTGPLNFQELFLVVPPNKQLAFIPDATGKYVRLQGQIGVLAPGEAFPADLLARFDKLEEAYYTYSEATISIPTSWVAGQELTALTLKPTSIEKYVLDSYVMVAFTEITPTAGQIALRPYLDGKPLDILETAMGQYGWDVTNLPRPPNTTAEALPFTLMDMPIEVLGDHELVLKLVNTSGATITTTAATATVTVVYRYYMVK